MLLMSIVVEHPYFESGYMISRQHQQRQSPGSVSNPMFIQNGGTSSINIHFGADVSSLTADKEKGELERKCKT